MRITKIEFQKLLNKIVSSLIKHFNDPKVINYNFYDNTSGVGVKMVRKTNRMTIEDLALEMRAGFAEQKKFNEKQEVFNQRVETFIAEQKVFNEWVKKEITEIKQDIVDIKQDIKDIKNCPTVARELKLVSS